MKFLTLIFSSLLATTGVCQLVTFSTSPVNLLAWGQFLGSNYTVSNISYNGHALASGSFDGSQTTIGLSSGIILTTGLCLNDTTGPIGPNKFANVGMDNGTPGFSLLNQLSSASTYNAAVIEFDFVPSVDSLEFNYVFGSEEYPEFAPPNNSSFNDVFGIFISGPGISGQQNIAVLPNNQVVGINSVNPVTNSLYYIYNGDGFTAPYNQEDQYIEYDGLTAVLKAKADLQIGETYHLIIAIADAGDGIYDSGLFLESCSTCTFHAGLNEEISNYLVYPNPTEGKIKIKGLDPNAVIEIYDLTGNKLTKRIYGDFLDLSDLSDGIYWVEFEHHGRYIQEKIVLRH